MSQQENFKAIIKGLGQILSDPQKIKSVRPSQKKVLTEFIESSEHPHTGIFDLATAFGKTRIMALLADAYHQNAPHQIVIAEPTRELVGQITEEFTAYFGKNPKVGQFFSEKKETDNPIIVTTYNSLEKLAQIINPDKVGLLLLDEGHHAVSDKRMEIVRRFSNACQYGMTATPDYSEDRTLKNLLTHTIAHVDIPQGIEDEILSPFSNIVLLSNFQMDLSGVKRIGGTGDYDISEYRAAFAKALSPVQMSNTEKSSWQEAHRKMAYEIALVYQGMASQKKHCLINCHTQEEARIQAEEINKVFGRTVAGVWTSDTQKTTALADFEAGKLGALCQVGMLQEGYDFPALDLCINYPTASIVRATQRGGRTLRLDPMNPQKQATIVDIVFSFPGSHNPYTSARKNNQVLYSDVVKAISVVPKSSHQGKSRRSPILSPIKPLNLKHFKLVSDVKTLLTLKRKDQQKEAAEYIPLKQSGMMSASDLKDTLGGTPSKYEALLQEIYNSPALNTHFDDNNNPFQLIHYVRSGNSKVLCLSDHPEAMSAFLEICKEKYPKRNEHKISLDEYARGHYLPREELLKIGLFLHAFKFQMRDENWLTRSLISKHQFNKDTLLFEDSDEAREDLNALITLTDYLTRIPKMPDDMCDLYTFKSQMSIKDEVINPFIRRIILDGKTYTDEKGQKKPLAQFYTTKEHPDSENIYGICVPKGIKGQTELLRLCNFNIHHFNISDIFKYDYYYEYDDETSWLQERWRLFKSARSRGLSLRDIGDELNCSREGARQIFIRVRRNILRALSRAEQDQEDAEQNRFANGNALLISDSEGTTLMTEASIRKEDYSRPYWLPLKSINQIIRADWKYRILKNQERDYTE